MRDTIADRLKSALKAAGLSPAQLARLSGATDQNLSQILLGRNKGDLKSTTLFDLADALNINARWLALGTGPRDRDDRIDSAALEKIMLDVFAATEALGTDYPLQRRIALAVRLYDVWCRSGEVPDIELAVSLFRSPLAGS